MNVISGKFSIAKSLFRHKINPLIKIKRFITSSEVAVALRPFYFAVHPDLFGQFPKEREINENSLKQLQEFLEILQQNEPLRPTTVTFYVRNVSSDTTSSVPSGSLTLNKRDLHETVKDILKSCQLSTKYVNSLPKTAPQRGPDRPIIWNQKFYTDPEEEIDKAKAKPTETLSSWLAKNYPHITVKLEISRPVREETQRLRRELIQRLELKDVLYKCGWGIMHFRGCLHGFNALVQQHPEYLHLLQGRTVVFERISGVNLDGHIILSTEDVRSNWLELIKSIPMQDETLKRIPAVEKAVSRVFRDIKVVHRKFQPAILVSNYESQLRKLCAALSDHYVKNGYPEFWPESLDQLQLVVECDAGPLMLSPTGQFIVPASCPAFLLVNFISEHLDDAVFKLDEYDRHKYLERDLHRVCQQSLELMDLQKDDNVTPDKMISFCQRLLQHRTTVNNFMRGSYVYVTHYYSVLQGGEVCIPWNWVE